MNRCAPALPESRGAPAKRVRRAHALGGLGGLRRTALECADHDSGRIHDVEAEIGGVGFEHIVDDRARLDELRLGGAIHHVIANPIRGRRMKELRGRRAIDGGQLMQGRHVVNDPDAPTHGREDKIAAEDFQIGHRRHR